MSKFRLGFLLVVVALAVSLPLATAAAGKPALRLGASASAGAFGCDPAAPVNVRANVTPSGPAVKITSGSVTFHWDAAAGGDQTYALGRAPGSKANAMKALVAVPAGQPLGLVAADVKVFVGATEFNKTISVKIVVCETTGG
jgi:hypothetical protein